MSEERHTCWQCGEECDCMSKPCITCTICDKDFDYSNRDYYRSHPDQDHYHDRDLDD